MSGYWEDYKCGCVSVTVRRKRDLLGYCPTHGADRRRIWPDGDPEPAADPPGGEPWSEKLLHVRVAEALGWKWKRAHNSSCRFLCTPTYDRINNIDPTDYPDASGILVPCDDAYRYVPRYDSDWSATGPLIERFGFKIEPAFSGPGWGVIACRHDGPDDFGATPLIAVCNVILALSARGKLGVRAGSGVEGTTQGQAGKEKADG